jgi:hypothetical protein
VAPALPLHPLGISIGGQRDRAVTLRMLGEDIEGADTDGTGGTEYTDSDHI